MNQLHFQEKCFEDFAISAWPGGDRKHSISQPAADWAYEQEAYVPNFKWESNQAAEVRRAETK